MSNQVQQEKIYEGKAKILFKTDKEDLIIQYFKDDATAFNNQKKAIIEGKGMLNNKISSFIMKKLITQNIPSHFIKQLNDREQLVKKVQIIPLEVIVRNIAAGSLSKRLGIKEGTKFQSPLLEFCYKNDELGDPLLNDNHVVLLNIATKKDIEIINDLTLKINDVLREIFKTIGIILVDFKIEFGKLPSGEIILADEISPDSCRLWDEKTNARFDKDLFRHDLGNLVSGYEEVAKRLGI